MSELNGPERAALAAVAERFSASWQEGDGESPDAWLTIAGERIAVEVVVIDRCVAPAGEVVNPRPRLDRVALRLVRRLNAALSASVPEGEALIVAIAAPIRLPSKTATALESMIGDWLARPSGPAEIRETIRGNQLRVRHARGLSRRSAKVIGFAHNSGTDPGVLLDLTQSLLRRVGAAADRGPPETFKGDRWLVVANDGEPWSVAACRGVYSQLFMSTDFKTVLMASVGGRVDAVIGTPGPRH